MRGLLVKGSAGVAAPGRRPFAGKRGAHPQRSTHARAAAAPQERGVLVLPGLGNSRADYLELAESLEARGLVVEIADVARIDWLRNAAGLRDPNYWKGTLNPRPTVDWYLNKVDRAAAALRDRVAGRSAMLTHSAGGWLGRLYLLDWGTDGFDRLVSLGSPHRPPPEGVAGAIDQTRGILTFCENTCPGCHHDEIKYITIAGKYMRGASLRGKGSVSQKVVGAGYQQVCGEADVWGDGIVPLPAAHLPGAVNVDLEGVYHSPLGSTDEDRPWYGSPGILDQWIHYLTGDTDELASTLEPLPGTSAL